jgi:hypothetical protein
VRESDIEKVTTPPHVHDATQPTGGTAPQGVLVAVVGTPIDGGVPVYDAGLGYCVWQEAATPGSPVTIDDGMGGFELVFDDDGNVVYA